MTRKRDNKDFTNNQYSPLTAKNDSQKQLFSTLNTSQMVFVRGPAGTGKTAVITSYAAQQLHEGRIDKIIVTRPAVEAAGEKLGFLPGSLVEDKFMPYLQPLKGIFEEVLGRGHYEAYVKAGKIEPVPLGYMRGSTYRNAIVIADEAQGMNLEQMEMLCTRIGEHCKLFCAGDEEQSDIRGVNGFTVACDYLQWIPECEVFSFDLGDIVRSPITRKIITSFRQYKESHA